MITRWVSGCWLMWAIAVSAPAAPPSENVQQLASLLSARCIACHGPDKQAGGYRVDTLARLRKPGDSGASPVVAGKIEQSELFKRLTTDDADLRMPAESPALPADQIALVRQWISAGAAIDPELEELSIAALGKRKMPRQPPAQYPSTLPVTSVALSGAAMTSEAKAAEDDTPVAAVNIWTSGYGEVLEWHLTDGAPARLAQRIATSGSHVAALDISGDNKLLAVSSGEPGIRGFVEVFGISEKAVNLVWSHACPDISNALAFSPDSQQLAFGQSDGTLWIAAPGSTQDVEWKTRSFAPHADAILGLNWSEQGNRLITGSRDRTAKIFDTSDWQLIANYDRHERAVGGVAYIEKHPVSLDETGKLRLWSGDDSDRTVAEVDNQARFLEHIVAIGPRAWYAMAGNLVSSEVESKLVDDGKDDAGKPKQKKSLRFKRAAELKSNRSAWILSVDVDAKFIAAGNEQGEVIVWRQGQAEPWQSFVAKPN